MPLYEMVGGFAGIIDALDEFAEKCGIHGNLMHPSKPEDNEAWAKGVKEWGKFVWERDFSEIRKVGPISVARGARRRSHCCKRL